MRGRSWPPSPNGPAAAGPRSASALPTVSRAACESAVSLAEVMETAQRVRGAFIARTSNASIDADPDQHADTYTAANEDIYPHANAVPHADANLHAIQYPDSNSIQHTHIDSYKHTHTYASSNQDIHSNVNSIPHSDVDCYGYTTD